MVDAVAGDPVSAAGGGTTARTKRLIALIVAIAIAPVVLSYLAYYLWPRDARVNYGELLPHTQLGALHGTTADGTPLHAEALSNRWLVIQEATGACERACRDALYATRQARTIQNAERERVVRVLVLPAAASLPDLRAEHPDLVVVRADPPPTLPRGADRLYLVDPLRNFVLAWPLRPDIKALAKDLTRLLRASSIG
ncbi:MAG TPA: hypothetical protein VFM89_05540 [Casimicrobiaceae bacterium]|nr:hypothetical protein [Casimicrobiaceae bacterium]